MRVLLAFIIILTSFGGSLAQKVSFVASTQKVVAVGEQFRISYQLNNKGTKFATPQMEGFRVLAGPNVSNGSSTSWINGQVTHSFTQTYTFIVQAQKAGKFTIPPASIKVENKTYKSNSLQIEVVNQGKQNRSNTAGNNISSDELFLRVSTPRRTVYLGEPVPLTIKIFTKVDLADLQNADFPEYKGFYSQDIETPEQITLQRENVNNTIYHTALLDKVLLYPQKTGEIKIDPAKIDAIIRKKVRRNRRDIFDDFFGGGYKSYRIPLTSNALKIKVKDLPANRPESFYGAVGKFKVHATVDNTELKANDALSYKIKISGNGNIKLLEDPKIQFPHDFDVWEPTVDNKIKNTSSGTKGSKTYEYVIQPRHPGDFEIPPFKFTYFDLKSKQYKTVSTERFKIKVTPGDKAQTVVSNVGVSKEDVELIGKDIRYIKTGNLALSEKVQPIFGTWKYWMFFWGGILLFVIIFLLKRKQIRENANIALQKNKKAKKEAVKRLKLAQEYLKKNESEHFFEELSKAMYGYLSDKLNISLSDLNQERVEQELSLANMDTATISELRTLIQECEIARYAPSQINMSKEELYQSGLGLISALENGIKNAKKA